MKRTTKASAPLITIACILAATIISAPRTAKASFVVQLEQFGTGASAYVVATGHGSFTLDMWGGYVSAGTPSGLPRRSNHPTLP